MEDNEYSQSEDDFEDSRSRCSEDCYSMSADVSESESSTSSVSTFSSRNRLDSVSTTSSPMCFASNRENLPPPQIVKPNNDKIELPELSEAELMKQKFSKLLLGEDLSGRGRGVSTALAISNAITNLAANVFGKLWKLEPLSAQKKSVWKRDMEWLLYVSYSIVELIPSVQELPGGGTLEVMVTRQRSDLYVNLPALKKLDAMLISILDAFQENEFYYVDRGIAMTNREQTQAYPRSASTDIHTSCLEEKCWLPFPKVPTNGLSDESRELLLHCKQCTKQIFDAAVAINSHVLSGMEVPLPYLEGLPKSEKTCLREILHRYITADEFSPVCFLDYLDLSSENAAVETANRIESAVHIWRLKSQNEKLNHAKTGLFRGSSVKGLAGDTEKNKLFAERANTLLKNLKSHLPGILRTSLDMNKIRFNKDIGHSILESYSRAIESVAFNLTARIDDLLYIDDATKRRAMAESISALDLKDTRRPRRPKSFSHSRSQPGLLDALNYYSKT